MVHRLRSLLADKRGNVLLLTAAAMLLVVGSAGLAIDTIQLSILKRHLQRAADSGALAGAYARAQSKPVPAAVDKALAFNDAFPLAQPATVTQPTTGLFGGRAVQVSLKATRSLAFWSFFSSNLPVIEVSATAALVYTGKYCMVSLDESAGAGITFAGDSEVNLGCGVISNTSGENAVNVNGNATSVTASPIAAVGGVPASSVYKQPTLLLPYSLKQPDPFSQVPEPSPPACSDAVSVGTGQTLEISPDADGRKCIKGLNVHGTAKLAPGTYYISGGDFSVNAGANLLGSEVTLIFTSPTPTDQSTYPKITINGTSHIALTAPKSGTYEGILMQYDARKIGGDYKINGGNGSSFEGAFYFPRQSLTFNGNSTMTTNCIQIVAYHVTFEGKTTISNSCPTGGGAKAFDASWVRLVA